MPLNIVPRSFTFRNDCVDFYMRVMRGSRIGLLSKLSEPMDEGACIVVLANISVAEHLRRQGLLSELLGRLPTQVPGLRIIKIESVNNPDLCAYLLREGYVPDSPDEPGTSWSKVL